MNHLREVGTCGNSATMDLFGYVGTAYPDSPGFKVRGASEEAARNIRPHAQTLLGKILGEFRAVYPRGLSADQAAQRVGASILSCRPRLSEMRANGWIVPLDEERATNDSGHSATVWRATQAALELEGR